MLVVVASRYDEIAQLLVSRWASYGARLLTCADLSLNGWYYPLRAPENGTAVISGEVVPVSIIHAVVTRLPCVYEQELIDIVPDDRPYVAAEMTAFLLSWLSELTCPVLHRPTPTCLSGPYWRQERWVYTAAHIGIPVQPIQRASPGSFSTQPMSLDDCAVTVTVVGQQCLGEVDETLVAQARHLADVAQVDVLSIRFSHAGRGAAFISADVWPDPLQEGLADAMLAYLQERIRRSS